MAEYLFRAVIGEGSGLVVGSAGVFAADGMLASENALRCLKEKDIDLRPHRSAYLTPELVDAAKLIVVMTAQHEAAIVGAFPEAGPKTRRLMSFSTEAGALDVADPVGGPLDLYRATRDQIDGALADVILYLRDQNLLNP